MRLTLFLGLLLCLITACDPDRDFVTGDAVRLRFEVDTVSFDTVFTARGSATQLFKVYNDASEPVRIDRVAVQGMTGVTFTFNIDGTMGPEARDVVIWGKDSIFVFVEAEVDPSVPEEVSPFIAEDLLVFETGNVQESVVLQAYGQNANYLNGFGRGQSFLLSCSGGTVALPADLPTVIYGSLFIDSCTVQVLAGSRVYFYGGIQRNNPIIAGGGAYIDGFIYTLPGGSLQLLGTADEPVILATDRLEEGFEKSRGAYQGLIFGPLSTNNRIEYAEINNAAAGVIADSLAEVTIDNTVIAFTSGPSLSTYQANVEVRNSLFHSSSGNSVQVVKGGKLVLDHTTLANYGGGDNVALSLVNDIPLCVAEECDPSPLTVRVRNSILAGFTSNELILADSLNGTNPSFFDVRIENSVVRTDEKFFIAGREGDPNFYETICQGCYNLTFDDPLFFDLREEDFHLDSLSVARDLGVFLPELPRDLEDTPRDTDRPDAGALEWVPGR
ncbi:hypothetical protein LEM8419_03210 [Neolewinella maritima]|uniref:Right-handed parallel beta-helix repeat-containing protein n=1 Tax=Neolewinella maritima TaxID=1383882 RepID=A0ABN8FD40_9BACT|nr:right-handed parallel beta-helix repeat-containing protein [Neolewinella maritima]CAH1002290.1 hypothetical protein LEM8419_03210 [Neolewinella maritima]